MNAYAAAALSVLVTLLSKVDFPTEGKPIKTARPKPALATSKPAPAFDDPPEEPSRSSAR